MTEAYTLTATRVAEYFRYRCERQFRYELVPMSMRGGAVPGANDDPALGPRVGPRPGARRLLAAGRQWERRVLERVIERAGGERVRFAGWRADGSPARLPYAEVVQTLRTPGEISVLVQPELRLPRGAEARWGIEADVLGFGSATPDLIRVVRGRSGRVRFQVVDIKASRAPGVPHYAQVAFYTLLLEAVLEAEAITAGVVDTRFGRIWARNGRGPERFPLAAYRHHVERFLCMDAVRLAAMEPTGCAWHLSARCGGCAFVEHCRADADATDDVSRIPGITPLAKRVLRERGIRTVRALAKDHRRETFTGCHALEANATRLRARAQALCYGKSFDVERTTELVPARESLRLVLTADADPITGRCFALGLGVAGRAVSVVKAQAFLAEGWGEEAERAMLLRALAVVEAALGEAASSRQGGGAGVHAYVYDHTERALLHALLVRHLGADGVREAVERVAALLGVGSGDAPGAGALGSVLVDAVSALVALPVPYAYDLAAVSAALAPREQPRAYRPNEPFAAPFSSQLAFEPVEAVWRAARRGERAALEEVAALVASKVEAVDSVLRGLRERSARAERLRLKKLPPAAAPDEPPLEDPHLESLRLFTRMEATAEALAVRALHALPAAERARRGEAIPAMELIERREDGSLVFEFDAAHRDVKFRVGDFTLLLSNDDGHTLGELAERPWDRRRLGVELIAWESGHERPRVVLAPTGEFDKAIQARQIDLDRHCVLDRAPADFTTQRVLATLRALDGGGETTEWLRALLAGRSPAGAACQGVATAEVAERLLAPGAARLGRAVLNADQEAAWRAALERALTLIWGPPGTGKTYLLAWVVLGLASEAKAAGRPCRVLVSAATHRAIVNVLARTAAEWGAAAPEVPLRLVKLIGSGNDADRELEGTPVECVDDRRLRGLLGEAASGAPLVVGSTVWSLWKQMRAAGGGAGEGLVQPWFDVVVIDEASQMKVPESLIALSALRPGGRAIVCGDDRQLAPITRGRYAGEEETLYGSIFAHLARFVRRHTLRESRRMNEALVRYPREVFYPGLVSMTPRQRIALAAAEPATDPLDTLLEAAFLAPADAVVFFTYHGVRAAARNPFEAALTARLARLARRRILDPATGERYTDERFVSHGLAVLSPHRAQNSAILAELRDAGIPEREMPLVDTVERMQGNEREMVIVSYAVADREYAEAEAEFLLNPNRFNVSITRARSKLIVLMSEEVLSAIPSNQRVLREALPVQAYRAHCADGGFDLVLPAPDGTPLQGRCHVLRLAAEVGEHGSLPLASGLALEASTGR